MSNYLGRKTEYTPSVYTRYFERTDTRNSSNGHVHFNENEEEELSETYQNKRDLLFKRLFPSKYADSNNNQTDTEQINQNGNNRSSTNTAQSLGDYISLSHDNSSVQKRHSSSPEADVVLSSENEDDLLIEESTILPNSRHESIVGHVHPRTTIENVRAVLIRELYERTNDPNTEWLKCKMNIPRDYINPKYYADFQRRYKKEIQRNTDKKKTKKSNSNGNAPIFDLTRATTIEIDRTPKEDDIIEHSPVIPSNDPSELILLDSDEDSQPKYFIDRSSTTSTAISQPVVKPIDDYQEEDSKYAQLPARSTSSPMTIIRPIISKNQRRKKHQPTTSSQPLVSAIDRIIDHMDQSNTLDPSQTMEQQNQLIKEIKKRKKKKKKKAQPSTGS